MFEYIVIYVHSILENRTIEDDRSFHKDRKSKIFATRMKRWGYFKKNILVCIHITKLVFISYNKKNTYIFSYYLFDGVKKPFFIIIEKQECIGDEIQKNFFV
jgi:hypothetical protein